MDKCFKCWLASFFFPPIGALRRAIDEDIKSQNWGDHFLRESKKLREQEASKEKFMPDDVLLYDFCCNMMLGFEEEYLYGRIGKDRSAALDRKVLWEIKRRRIYPFEELPVTSVNGVVGCGWLVYTHGAVHWGAHSIKIYVNPNKYFSSSESVVIQISDPVKGEPDERRTIYANGKYENGSWDEDVKAAIKEVKLYADKKANHISLSKRKFASISPSI